MRFAHSLGYPHPDLMLEEMSAAQLSELFMFFRLESEEKESLAAEAQEAKIREFLRTKMRKQKKANG